MNITDQRHASKIKLLNAALQVVRAKGYSATRIEDICEAAGLTKGSFFHHFKSKEEMAIAAAQHWADTTSEFFASAPYHAPSDPVDRLLAYVDFRKAILQGELVDYTCFVGTMVQEVYESHPALREACEKSISGHAETLEHDIAAAMQQHHVSGSWTAQSLALYTQSVIQGAFVLAKAQGGPDVATACLDHLRHYLELLFSPSTLKGDS
ncbi:TetR/AcrR family transcriptional regulator [bacterium]|nr:MAG: TetR/AcrR family transcriptional regulator [bacterium]